MNTCKTCKYWGDKNDQGGHWADPSAMRGSENECARVSGFSVKRCMSVLEHARPMLANQATCCDGSEYLAHLMTASEFGCVNWEEK